MSNTAQAAPEGVAFTLTLTFDEALHVASERHRAGRLDESQPIYEALLGCAPQRADLLSQLGILHHQRGDHARALERLQAALAQAPDSPGLWNNLGNVLVELERTDEAEQAFERSLALADNAEAHSNLARLRRGRNDWPASEAAARRALELEPESGGAWHSLTLALLGQSRHAEATAAAVQALPRIPPTVRYLDLYARVLLLAGERAHAAEVYAAWAALDPDDDYPRHHLGACLGGDGPARASDSYVEGVFDRFAASFDTQLAKLEYRAPELVADALRAALPAPDASRDIGDLGCGTGLCGPLVKPWARRLVGVDLSRGMLERAAQRGVYDELHKAELVQFLEARPQAFDLLVAADTLIYFGDLEAVARAAATALRPDGRLILTIEDLADPADRHYELHTSGRYAHSGRYLRETLASAGLAVEAEAPVVLRMESFAPVSGRVVTAIRRPDCS
jgi:predicted TPR repeat methyltransferase